MDGWISEIKNFHIVTAAAGADITVSGLDALMGPDAVCEESASCAAAPAGTRGNTWWVTSLKPGENLKPRPHTPRRRVNCDSTVEKMIRGAVKLENKVSHWLQDCMS